MRFFSFSSEIPFLDEFGPKNKSCQFRLTLRTLANSNMQNSIVVFISSRSTLFGDIWSKK